MSTDVTILNHGANCREFLVRSPSFNLRRFIIFTSFINLIGFCIGLHLQNEVVLLTLILLLVSSLLLKLYRKVSEESLLVITSVGVQLTTKFFSGRQSSRFLDITSIHDIVISETITMQRVIAYLAILLHQNDSNRFSKVVPLFLNTLPCLSSLQEIYNGIHDILPLPLTPTKHSTDDLKSLWNSGFDMPVVGLSHTLSTSSQ